MVISLVSYVGFNRSEEMVINGHSLQALFIHRVSLEKFLHPIRLELLKTTTTKKKDKEKIPQIFNFFDCMISFHYSEHLSV